MGAVGDIVLVEDTGSDWDGIAGRVVEISDDMVAVEFANNVIKPFPAEKLGLATYPTTLLIEKYCSYCDIMSYDNKSGGYNHAHVNKETGVAVKCDYDGKLYVEGCLIPPRRK